MALCDEVIVAVGKSEDGTRDLVASLNDSRLRIVDTTWDESLREGGRVLAIQTDLALSHCRGDWCLYLQADEVLHESEHDQLRSEIEAVLGNPQVEALVLNYYHFYGSYDYVGKGRQWYRREIRAFRNSGDIVSWRDAQGFRRRDFRGSFIKLQARKSDCHVYHYGWVKHPRLQQEKQRFFHQLWHDDEWIARNFQDLDEFDYRSAFAVDRFTGTHPAIMIPRLEKARSWTARFDPTRLARPSYWQRVLDGFENLTGARLGEYRNFVEVQ